MITLIMGLAIAFSSLQVAETPAAQTVRDLLNDWQEAKIENVLGEAKVRQASSGGLQRRAVQLHPTQKRATASFDINLPAIDANEKLALTFLAGLDDSLNREDKNAPIDGVRFFLDINGLTVHTIDILQPGWQPVSIDLSQHAGKSVRITFAFDAKNNANYDWAQLAEPKIVRVSGSGQNTLPAKLYQGVLEIKSSSANEQTTLEAINASNQVVGRINLPLTNKPFYYVVDNRQGNFTTLRLRGAANPALTYYPFSPRLKLESVNSSRGLVSVGETFEFRATVRNIGEGAYTDNRASLSLANLKGLTPIDDNAKSIGAIAPGETATVAWRMKAVKAQNSSAIVKMNGQQIDAIAGIVPTINALPTINKAGIAAASSNAFAYAQNEAVRVVFQPSSVGAAMRVFARTASGWTEVAVSAPLMLTLGNGSGAPPRSFPFRIDKVNAVTDKDTAYLKLKGETSDLWAMEIECKLEKGALSANLKAKLTPRVNADLYALKFPDLKVGDGSGSKDGALFPGLEYLLKDESSSSTEFAAPPYDQRWSPHPFKVTLPFMAVRQKGVLVSLIWEPNQEWMSGFYTPMAMFASPNFLEKQDNHRLALWVPSTRNVNEENSFPARKSTYVIAGASITLSADILVQAKSDSLLNIVEWYLKNRPIPGIPQTERSGIAALDLATLGLLNNYVPDERAWRHTNTGPTYFDALVALPLWVQTWITSDDDLRSRALRQVRESVEKAGIGATGDLAFHLANIEPMLQTMRRESEVLMNSQREDGSWAWAPPSDRHKVFGKAGDTSSGHTGRNAAQLWSYARLTGDPRAIAAGIKALALLDKLGRPEGAQTWELPLHVPDILASAFCINAYLDGYLVTGNKRYLERARYWALAGLPFTYLWSSFDRPIMRYATIPVLGITWFSIQSWFGVAVQWNGLEYARALLRLAPYDLRMDWFKIGEGITYSGVQQMEYATKKYRNDAGMYPDAYSVVKGDEEYYWNLNPRLLALNLLTLQKANPFAQAQRIKYQGNDIVVASVGDMSTLKLTENTLEFTVGYYMSASSEVLISNVNKPTLVEVDTLSVAETNDLANAVSGWKYLSDSRQLVIKISHSTDRTAFRITL